NPVHLWRLRRELGSYLRWSWGQKLKARDRQTVSGMDPRLQGHVDFALKQFGLDRKELSATMVKHQLKLADRQCRIAELSQRVQDAVTMLVTALWAHGKQNEVSIASADILCQDLRRKLTGKRPSDRYFRDVGKLADVII